MPNKDLIHPPRLTCNLPWVAVVALRQPRPHRGRNACLNRRDSRKPVAPLHAALLLAARGVPPRGGHWRQI